MLCSTQHTFTKSSTSDMSLTSIDSLKMRKRFLSIPKTRLNAMLFCAQTHTCLPTHNSKNANRAYTGSGETERENTRTCC